MRRTVTLLKNVGETPLEVLERFKAGHREYESVPLSYAGRLDPMASGKLLVLIGEECKKQKKYVGLDKCYDIEVLLDVGSDTGDILGLVKSSTQTRVPDRTQVRRILRAEKGTHTIPYPVFSSKTVGGKPLFLYALEGTLDSIHVPTHDETIYDIRLRDIRSASHTELRRRIDSLLALAPTSTAPSKALGADFRIEAVRTSWKEVFELPRTYTILRLTVSCGSGTYMRSLAGRIGDALGTKALALSIHRTRIGIRRPWWSIL